MQDHQTRPASISRRRMLKAGGFTALAPTGALTVTANPAHAAHALDAGGDPLVLSGQCLSADGRPRAGCEVAFVERGHMRGRAVTDGDGRFVIELVTPAAGAMLAARVGDGDWREVAFAGKAGRSAVSTTRERDAEGFWRAAVALKA